MVCTRCHHNLDALEQALVETVDNFVAIDNIDTDDLTDFGAVLGQMVAILNNILWLVVHYTSNKL